MQHERDAFRRAERFEHDQQREADRVRQHRFVLGPLFGRGFTRARVVGDQLLAAALARTQHVEADAGDDGRQPAAEVRYLSGIGTTDAHPRFLERVFSVAPRSDPAPWETLDALEGRIDPCKDLVWAKPIVQWAAAACRPRASRTRVRFDVCAPRVPVAASIQPMKATFLPALTFSRIATIWAAPGKFAAHFTEHVDLDG
ncbi:MAG TPA: hypothetical protein VIW69_18430, partial [Candidatus Elarobacter sp.]